MFSLNFLFAVQPHQNRVNWDPYLWLNISNDYLFKGFLTVGKA